MDRWHSVSYNMCVEIAKILPKIVEFGMSIPVLVLIGIVIGLLLANYFRK